MDFAPPGEDTHVSEEGAKTTRRDPSYATLHRTSDQARQKLSSRKALYSMRDVLSCPFHTLPLFTGPSPAGQVTMEFCIMPVRSQTQTYTVYLEVYLTPLK